MQTARRGADASTGAVLMSRQRDFTQQLVCGHAADLADRLAEDGDRAQFATAYSLNRAKINTPQPSERVCRGRGGGFDSLCKRNACQAANRKGKC